MLTIRLVSSFTGYRTMYWLNTDGDDDIRTRSFVSPKTFDCFFVTIVFAEMTFDNGKICFMTSAFIKY